MGLFGSKVLCCVCNAECGGLNKFPIKDKEYICSSCFDKGGLKNQPIKTLSVDDVKRLIEKRNANLEEVKKFKATKEVAGWLKVDEPNRKWLIPDGTGGKIKNPTVYSYDDVVDYELLEDGNSIAKGGIGGAVAGGLLFGGVGAIVGGTTGKKKTKSTCTSLKLKITLNSMEHPTEYINFITVETKKDSFLYKLVEPQSQECLSIFQLMCESNKAAAQQSTQPAQQSVSVADEIKKFKELLDMGAITQEEFDAKKKELLNL